MSGFTSTKDYEKRLTLLRERVRLLERALRLAHRAVEEYPSGQEPWMREYYQIREDLGL